MSKFSRLYSWYFGIPLMELILIFILNPSIYNSVTRYMGAITGLLSYVWLTFEFILTARQSRIEKEIGQDILIKFHIYMSFLALFLAMMHAGLTMSSGNYNRLIIRMGAGIVGGYAILMILALFFLLRKPKLGKPLALRYHISIIIHNFSMLLTFILWVHVMQAEASRESVALKILYSSHILVALSYWAYHKIFRRILLQKKSYIITEIRKESRDIWSLFLTNTNKKNIKFEAGQFGYFSILQKGFSKEFHPFTFSSSPNDTKISILIKELGDYTSKLGVLQIGSQVLIDGPYGRFKPLNATLEELVFIAGGVGITPFLASLEILKESTPNRKVTLIYGMRTQSDLIKSDYFKNLQKSMSNFLYISVLSDDDEWAGECGFIDQSRLENYAACEDIEPSNQKKEYFICGPPEMIKKVKKSLKLMNVAPKFIHTEKF